MKVREVIAVGFILLAVLFISGCASTALKKGAADSIAQTRHDLKQAQKVYANFSGLPFALLPSKKTNIEFNNSLPVYRLDQHNTYVKGFQLPAFIQPYRIIIKGSGRGFADGNVAMFAPVIYTLDAHYQVLRVFKADDLVRRGATTLERTVFINPSNRAEQYLLIFGETGDLSFESSTASITTAIVPAGPVIVPWHSASQNTSRIYYAPTGRVEIEAIP